MKPLVSVVIPTYRRPELVVRAVRSALAQTLESLEVIVVLDGPDEATRRSLTTVDDPRLIVIEQPSNQGCAVSRRTGVEAAQAPWIAYLDDDDEWMPEKLERQIALAEKSSYPMPIVSCYVTVKTPTGEYTLPRRTPTPTEPLSEYLFVRNSFFKGEGLIQTSTILTSKSLLQQISSRKHRHDDWDWLLRATALDGVGIEFVPETLAVWYLGGNRHSISRSKNWQYSLDWIREQRELVTPRAYSAFVLTEVSAKAAATGDWKAFWTLPIEAIRFGKPRVRDLGLHIGMWTVPSGLRRTFRLILSPSRLKSSLQRLNPTNSTQS